MELEKEPKPLKINGKKKKKTKWAIGILNYIVNIYI